MKHIKIQANRREFLKHCAKTGVLMPLALNFLGHRDALAAGNVERVIYVYYPNGIQDSPGDNGRVYHPRSPAGTTGSNIDLNNTCLEAFANADYNGTSYDLRNDMIFLRNLHLHGQKDSHGEGAAAIWSCNDPNAGTTINCEVAKRRHQATTLSTEHLMLGTLTREAQMSKKDGQYLPSEINPHAVLNTLKGYTGSNIGSNVDSGKQRQILELLEDDLATLEALDLNNTESAKIEAHKTQYEELKRRLATGPVNCSDINALQLRTNQNTNFAAQDLNWTDVLRDQIDLAVMALSCGMTSVVTLKHAVHTSDISHRKTTNLGNKLLELSAAAGQRDYNEYMFDHSASHVREPAHLEMSHWFHSQMAYLVAQLKARNLLDSTIVVAMSENADGSRHNADDGGWWVAGGGNALNTGRILDVNGQRHSTLLVDIAKALGTGITGWGTSESSIPGFLRS